MKLLKHHIILSVLVLLNAIAAAQTPPTPPSAPPSAAESKGQTEKKPDAKKEARVAVPSKECMCSTKPIDAAGQKQIDNFIASRATQILQGDTAAVRVAAGEIIAVLRQAIATPIFLRACETSLRTFVTQIIATNDTYRASNILQVVRWTNTTEGLDILIAQSTPSTQKNSAMRIAASRLLPGCVTTANLTAPQIESAARRIREAADSESEWIVSVHDMQALAAMTSISQDGKMAQQMDIARGEFLKALASTAAKAAQPASAEQIFALQRGLIILRDMLLKTPKDQITKIASDIRPSTQIAAQLAKQYADQPNSNDAINKSSLGAKIAADAINSFVGLKPAPSKSPA